MKTMKRLASLLLALTLVFAFAATASADTITFPDNGHTYEVYQIFTGDLHEGVLSNVKWGQNGNGTVGESVPEAVLTELTGTTGSDAEKLAVIKKHVNLESPFKTVTDNRTLDAPSGYYLIKDVDGALDNTYDAYTTYIVQVAGNVTIAPKAAKPTVDKQVHDEAADAESGASEGWGETADHAINESFQFKLIADLPVDPDFAAYDNYKVEFYDTMSDGVTFESIASVTVDGVTLTTDQYSSTATAGQAGGAWNLTIGNIKLDGVNIADGAQIVVIYNAHLNENAQVNKASGVTSNKNSVYLKYSNNPNADGMGQTLSDHVWVFTYGVDNTKMDATDTQNKTPLQDAGFKLYNSTGETEIGLIYDSNLAAYRPVKGAEAAEEMKSAADGKFNIVGLDTGTYILKETTVPAGYNKCEDVTVVISATHIEDGSGESAATTLSSDSTVKNVIENKKGSTLPETGGIGTTIFYVIGGILVAAAVVLLVTRKRVNGAE